MTYTSGVVIAPSALELAPVIRGEPDMVGLLLGSRELLRLSSRISRTLVGCSSLSELYLPGESTSCPTRGMSLVWWSNIIFLLARRGVFQGGSTRRVDLTSRQRRVKQGLDTSRRYRLQVRQQV